MLQAYLKRIFGVARRGDDREESYYSSLESLVEQYLESAHKKGVHITTLPKKTEAGNPDFRVWDGKVKIVGYIEAKPPHREDLDEVEESEQLKRYREIFPNLILTNFLEFRLYRNGEQIDRALIARPFIFNKLKTVPPAEDADGFMRLLEKYFAFSLPAINTAETLAVELAKRTRFLRDEVISQEVEEGGPDQKGFIHGFYEAFRRFLIADLSPRDFADLYSQTITYGLFAARTRSVNGFDRKLAYDNIPPTIGILRDVFEFVSRGKLPLQMETTIDDISEVLAVTDVNKILHRFFREGKGKDPIVHFYETFLNEYDPKTREKRGVYYTPEAVVSYIVRSVHSLLKDRFQRTDGLAEQSVTVLDPAAGTLTFLAEAAKLASEEFIGKYGDGGKANFIREHILRDFYAFELMMAPYAVGHIKISFLLEELGYRLREDDRVKLYLTNTLEMDDLEQSELPGMVSLSEESHLAGKVKKETPILVIVGNPPYSGHSANRSVKTILVNTAKGEKSKKVKTWIGELIETYKTLDGKPLGEKNPKWLQDDYVKFIRFSQWKIDQAGQGILGFVTNHSYLDNPTFRGMRRSLMKTFQEIYILDLHGNSLKKEKCPDGSKDENVFDIQQGVAIALFIKKAAPGKECRLHHAGLWGLREKKYSWLQNHDIETTQWKRIRPDADFYSFVPRSKKGKDTYEKSPKLTDIFPLSSVGIVTARDYLTIHWTPEEAWNTVLRFSIMDPELARLTYHLGPDTKDWKVVLAQRDLMENGLDKNKIVPILYRPFDIRYTYYTGHSGGFMCRPRPEVMQHMLQANVGLISPKQFKEKAGAFTTAYIMGHKTVSAYDINYLFPLYRYATQKGDLFRGTEGRECREINLNASILRQLNNVHRRKIQEEDLFYYAYAILYSRPYSAKYSEYLKIDFPRIPITLDSQLFHRMAKAGQRLIDLHLLRPKEVANPVAKLKGKGGHSVEKCGHEGRRVYINEREYFEGISAEVWGYQIGGYQVCEKWLKDRRGRLLTLEEIKHYCRTVTSISKTIEMQKALDGLYPKIEKTAIDFTGTISSG